jgi:hypothetical protein
MNGHDLPESLSRIPWGHNILLLEKIADPILRLWPLKHPIGIAEYRLTWPMPDELAANLPSPAVLYVRFRMKRQARRKQRRKLVRHERRHQLVDR